MKKIINLQLDMHKHIAYKMDIEASIDQRNVSFCISHFQIMLMQFILIHLQSPAFKDTNAHEEFHFIKSIVLRAIRVHHSFNDTKS